MRSPTFAHKLRVVICAPPAHSPRRFMSFFLLALWALAPQCLYAETLDNILHSSSTPIANPLLEKRSAILRDAPQDKIFASGKFQKLLARTRNLPLKDKLLMVNRFCNTIPYRPDNHAWRQKEYWATPSEFFARGGDCEDFAIIKYALLRKLGLQDRQMRIICLEAMDTGGFHAVLAVEMAGKSYILDNNYPGPQPSEALKLKYFPLFSLNASQAWRHELTCSGNKLKTKAADNLQRRKMILRDTAKKLRKLDTPGDN